MESLCKRNKKEMYMLYVHYCKTVGIAPVQIEHFSDSIYYDAYDKYIEFNDKEG